MTEEEALKRWPDESLSNYADPARERARRKTLSEKASARHQEVVDPETGRRAFGGAQPGSGRPRKPSLMEQITEMAENSKNKEVLRALFSGLDKKKNSPAQQVRTAEKIIKITSQQRELEQRERDFKDDPKDALIKFIAPRLAQAIKKGKLGELAAILELDVPEAETVEGTVVGEPARLSP